MHASKTAFAVGLLAALAAQAVCAQQPELPTRPLTAGVHLITAEVAANPPSREMGLMFRRSLQPNHGMLFVFDGPNRACMWMRNTLLPLSVAFMSADGRILNIEDMAPQTETVHCAKADALFALEMTKGWFAERGLKSGQTVIGGLPH